LLLDRLSWAGRGRVGRNCGRRGAGAAGTGRRTLVVGDARGRDLSLRRYGKGGARRRAGRDRGRSRCALTGADGPAAPASRRSVEARAPSRRRMSRCPASKRTTASASRCRSHRSLRPRRSNEPERPERVPRSAARRLHGRGRGVEVAAGDSHAAALIRHDEPLARGKHVAVEIFGAPVDQIIEHRARVLQKKSHSRFLGLLSALRAARRRPPSR